MPNISKHDREEEGESHDCEHSRVDFTVAGNPISMHNLLEAVCDFGGLKVSWRALIGHQRLEDCPNLQESAQITGCLEADAASLHALAAPGKLFALPRLKKLISRACGSAFRKAGCWNRTTPNLQAEPQQSSFSS